MHLKAPCTSRCNKQQQKYIKNLITSDDKRMHFYIGQNKIIILCTRLKMECNMKS